MAEFGIIASVIQIADVGLRLSIKLYTFGEIVASADRSVISISKDVSLTSSVLKELGQILGNDKESRLLSKNAVDTADTVVKECLEVFEEMESILVKKLPNLRTQGGKTPKSVLLLERLKWSYLQPKLQLLRSNLDRLKSTLLLMLNVITYARQVSGKSEPPSVVADQKSLIQDLARSNREYIRRYEALKLAIETKPSDTEQPFQANTQDHKLGSMPSSQPTRSPTVGINTLNITTAVQNAPVPRNPGISTREPNAVTDTLLTHLEHYLNLLISLLKEADEAKHEIGTNSRTNMKADICQIYEREMRDLVILYDFTSLRRAETQLAPLVARVRKRAKHATESKRTLDTGATPTSLTVGIPDSEARQLNGGMSLGLIDDEEVEGAADTGGLDGDTDFASLNRDPPEAFPSLPPMVRCVSNDMDQDLPQSIESKEHRQELMEPGPRDCQQPGAMELLRATLQLSEDFYLYSIPSASPQPSSPTISPAMTPMLNKAHEATAWDGPESWGTRDSSPQQQNFQSGIFDRSDDFEDVEGTQRNRPNDGHASLSAYHGQCRQGSVLDFLRRVMFMWPVDLGKRLRTINMSVTGVCFVSSNLRFNLDKFHTSLKKLHAVLNSTPIERASDQDLDHLHAILTECNTIIIACESFVNLFNALCRDRYTAENGQAGRPIWQNKELSFLRRELDRQINASLLRRLIDVFATGGKYRDFPSLPDKAMRLSYQRRSGIAGESAFKERYSANAPILKPNAVRLLGLDDSEREEMTHDIVDSLMKEWTTLFMDPIER